MSKKLLILLLFIGSLLLLMLVIFTSQRKYNANIFIAPKDAKIFLDGKQIKDGKQNLLAGSHILKATRDGFKTKDKKIFIDAKKKNEIYVNLSPASEEGYDYYNKNTGEFNKIEILSQNEYNNNATNLLKQYPIINDLPQDIYPLYKISYGSSKKYADDPSKIAIYIQANTPQNRQNALNLIRSLGYDTSDYEIVFDSLSVEGGLYEAH